MSDKCEWAQDEDGAWDTQCCNRFEINEGTPADNDMAYCCYCGKPIEQTEYVSPWEDEEPTE